VDWAFLGNLDVVKHSLFGFAIGAVGCVNLSVAQSNSDCFGWLLIRSAPLFIPRPI
jgi:hypothetical protein